VNWFSRTPKIRVIYRNGSRAKVLPEQLSVLLADEKISQFQRMDGWVTIGIDRIRGMGGPPYLGDNRRNLVDTANLTLAGS